MFLQMEELYITSLMVPSQALSKLVPISSPFAFNTGLPLFPPVVWLEAIKATRNFPFLSAYCP